MSLTNITAGLPKKSMTKHEIKLLQVLPEHLKGMASAESVMSELLRLIASWMGSPSSLGFEPFAKAWLLQGNAKDRIADSMLRDIFGLNGPEAA